MGEREYGESGHLSIFTLLKALCLVHIWLAVGLRRPYPARIPLSVRPPRGLPAEAGGGCDIFVRIHGLRGLYDLV